MQAAIGSLTPINSLPEISPSQLQMPAEGAPPAQFANMLAGQVGEMNTNVTAAERVLSDLAAGKAVEPQEAMISMERARISVLTFVQLRNKLIESYQDVMRMQL